MQDLQKNCLTSNFSRSGVYFETATSLYHLDMEVYVLRTGLSGVTANGEERGFVTRVDKLQGGKCGVAVRLIPEA